MAPGSSSSKKRKHDEVASASPSSNDAITVSISDDANRSSALLPLLCTAPALQLPGDTSLSLYVGSSSSSSGATPSKGKGKDRSSASSAPSMLHGESSQLEFNSSNHLQGLAEDGHSMSNNGESYDDAECSTSYALALYDPSTSSLSVVPTPLHILSHMPKRLKGLASMVSNPLSGESNAAARAELGLSFGTKKSIKAIRAAERNKVDAGAADLQVVQDVMMQGLDTGLQSLPHNSGGTPRRPGGGIKTEEEEEEARSNELAMAAHAAAKTGRPIPNITAERTEDVYRVIGEVMLQKELDAINITALLKETDVNNAFRLLPFKASAWVNDRLKNALQTEGKENKKKKLKILTWISGLMAIKRMGKGGLDPNKDMELKKRFGGGMSGTVLPPPSSSSMLQRFAEPVRGTKNLSMTATSESRLLCFLFLACLYYDNFTSLDVTTLSNDLGLQPKRTTEIVKSLGAKIITPKAAELDKIVAKWQNEGRGTSVMNASSSGAGKVRVASLRVPLEFPRERKLKSKK